MERPTHSGPVEPFPICKTGDSNFLPMWFMAKNATQFSKPEGDSTATFAADAVGAMDTQV